MVSVAFCTDKAVRCAVETVPACEANQHKSDVGVVDGENEGEDEEAAPTKPTRARSLRTFRRESDRLFNVRLSHSPYKILQHSVAAEGDTVAFRGSCGTRKDSHAQCNCGSMSANVRAHAPAHCAGSHTIHADSVRTIHKPHYHCSRCIYVRPYV